MSRKLLAFDTDHIKGYVFATGTLRDIRGASAILDSLNRREMTQLVLEADPSAQKIYAHGGSGLFVVDETRAEAAQRAVQESYSKTTESASISAATTTLPDEAKAGDDFYHAWRQLAYRLRAAKDRTPATADLPSNMLLRPCEACGARYSKHRDSGPDGEQRICGSCQRKRDEDERIRRDDIPRWLSDPTLVATDTDPLWQRLIVSLRHLGYPLRHSSSRPRDFDTLAELSRPTGYLGLIYADGDGIGHELEKLRTLEEIGYFARAVDEAAYHALVRAVTQFLRPRRDSPNFPFDVLLVGGDDIVLVTAAERALEVAQTLVEEFSRETEERLRLPLRLSASVIIAHARYPFAALLRLAEGGLQFAKREAAARRRRGEILNEGLVNFLVATGVSHLDFDVHVERVLRTRPPNSSESLDRTLRPYRPAELQRLIQAVRTLARDSRARGRIQRLQEACYLDHLDARVAALATLLRWPAGESKRQVTQLIADLARSTGGGEVQFPWFLASATDQSVLWRTPLADVAEIFDFVGG